MTPKKILYWITTLLLVAVFGSGGIVALMQVPSAAAGMHQLGYPPYFPLILGTWKCLGAIAIVIPATPRLKEWAYAGMVFDLTGASASHAFSHDAVAHIVAPLIVLCVLAVSWAFRPSSRKLAGPVF